jgi:hypothetical protein
LENLIGHATAPPGSPNVLLVLIDDAGFGLIVAYPHSAADRVEPAVTRAITKVVGQAEGHHVEALKAAIADAQSKLAPQD